MPVVVKNTFMYGELGQAIQGRTDTEQYDGGLFDAYNIRLPPQGSASKRQGSRLFTEVTLPSWEQGVRMVEYEFDISHRYFLLFVGGNLHIYGLDRSGFHQQMPTPYIPSDLPNLQWSSFGNLLYLVDGRNEMHQLSRESDDHFTLSPYVFEISPQSEASLSVSSHTTLGRVTAGTTVDIAFFPTGDVSNNEGLYERAVLGVGLNTFQGVIVAMAGDKVKVLCTRDGEVTTGDAFSIKGSPSTYLKPSGLFSVGQTVEVGTVTSLTDPKALPRLQPALGKYLSIGGGLIEIDNAQCTDLVVKGKVLRALESGDSTSTFTYLVDAFTGETQPRSIAQYAGRLWLGGVADNRQRLWASDSLDFKSFYVSVRDGDGIEMDLVSTESASIQWLHPTQAGLVAGCASSEIVVAGADKVVTPTTVTQEVSTVVGSNRQQPLSTNTGLIFISSDDNRIWSYEYNFQTESYVPNDLCLTNDDITRIGIKSIARSVNPHEVVYALLENGTIAMANAHVVKFKIYGWSLLSTPYGKIVSMVVCSGRPSDDLVILVERAGKLWIEVISWDVRVDDFTPFIDFTAYAGQSQVTHTHDALSRTSKAKVDMPHLDSSMAGAEWACLWDGVWINGDITIEDGYFTVDTTELSLADAQGHNAVIQLGLLYDMTLETLPLVHDDGTGEGVFFQTEIRDVRLRIWDTGRTFTFNGERALDGLPANMQGDSLYLYTGVVELRDDTLHPQGGSVVLHDKSPRPFNTNGLWLEVF